MSPTSAEPIRVTKMASARDELGPLRIALVHAADEGGGAEKCVLSLHRALLGTGHDSTLFVGQKHLDEPGVIEIPYVRGTPGIRRVARTLESLVGYQDIYNPSFTALGRSALSAYDVVNFHTLWGSAGYADIGVLPFVSRNVPTVMTLHDSWFLSGHCACFHNCMRWKTGCGACPDLSLTPAIRRDATASNWRRKKRAADGSGLHVVAVYDWLKEQAQASPILQSCAISRIYNGIDLKVFEPPTPARRLEIRRQFGFHADDLVVMLAGQTVEGINEGIATAHAVNVLARLADDARVKALVVGRSAAAVCGALPIPSVCLPFQSSTEKMASCYQAADVCLVTSEFETFGRIAAEAQGCATPVVAFDTGGLPEVVRHGVGGLIVSRADPQGLLDAMSCILRDAELRTQYGKQGRAFVRDNFEQGLVARHYVSLYRSMISQRRQSHA